MSLRKENHKDCQQLPCTPSSAEFPLLPIDSRFLFLPLLFPVFIRICNPGAGENFGKYVITTYVSYYRIPSII